MANFFDSRLSAERYAGARPAVHGAALAQFVACSGVAVPVGAALDVGCGTGQSTLALAELAERVVGIDASDAMLAQCVAHPGVTYRKSVAEQIAAGDGEFDLVTVSLAFHWLDQGAFLSEAFRVLAVNGWLVIYNAGFTGAMMEHAGFARWFRDEYLVRYPTPPRKAEPITDVRARTHGFVLVGEDSFSVQERMNVRRFTDFQLSTTNVIAAVQEQESRFIEADRWIAESIASFFDGEGERTFRFTGRCWWLQKQAR